jgi:hypothetical protein
MDALTFKSRFRINVSVMARLSAKLVCNGWVDKKPTSQTITYKFKFDLNSDGLV